MTAEAQGTTEPNCSITSEAAASHSSSPVELQAHESIPSDSPETDATVERTELTTDYIDPPLPAEVPSIEVDEFPAIAVRRNTWF